MTSTTQAGHLLQRARWAAAAYADYDAAAVHRIVDAVAEAACVAAERFAAEAVAETGIGVAADKATENRACSRGVVEHYCGADQVSPRVDTAGRSVELPRPAGVVLAPAPAPNPVATVYLTTLLALMTRNAVVHAPRPGAIRCAVGAARLLAEAAVAAGAPDGVVQVLGQPTVDLEEALRDDERTAMVLDAGSGNVPVFVDAGADVDAAAAQIVASKAFDNSLPRASESVLIAEAAIADTLSGALTRAGGHLLDEDDVRRLRAYLFADGQLLTEVVGRDAAWIAEQAGLRIAAGTRVLIAPFGHVIGEEPLAHEKPCPVLGMTTAVDTARGIRAAQAVVRIGAAGRCAAVHSQNPSVVLDFAARVPVSHVSVNTGSNPGTGHRPLGADLAPEHLITWVRIGSAGGAVLPTGDFTSVTPWAAPAGPVPEYPRASNDRAGTPVMSQSPGGQPR